MLVRCGQKVIIQTHGIGLQWHCPVCDTYQGERLPIISWWRSPPPKDGCCHQKRNVFPCRSYNLSRFLFALQCGTTGSELVTPERWEGMRKFVLSRETLGEPLEYPRPGRYE